MKTTDKLTAKLLNLNIKKKELNTLLRLIGFTYRKGKGSHEIWSKESYVVTIATHSKEVPRFILRELVHYLRENDLLEEGYEKGQL